MRQYKIKETKEIEAVICNKCGKTIHTTNGRLEEDMLNVEKRWGYASGKDNEVHQFDLCEACYDELTKGFQIPVTIKE